MSENIWAWSITASDNDDADPAVPWPENMLPGAVNNAARSTMAAVARLLADINGTLVTTGSSNAYAVTCNSGVTAFTDGQLVTAKLNFSNTTACTLNLNSLGAKAIRVFGKGGEVDPTAGQCQSGMTAQFRYSSAASGGSGAFILLNPVSTEDVGTMKIWSTDTAPDGWLFCNGQAVSRTTYAALFAVISTTYGTGNGSTTFNVPDLAGRAPFGSTDMGGISSTGRITNAGSGIDGTVLGTSGGVESVTLSTSQIPSHTHGVNGSTGADASHTHAVSGTTGAGSAHNHTITITDPGHTHPITTHTVLPGGGGTLTASDLTSTGNTLTTVSNTTGITASSVNESAHTHPISFTSGAGSSHAHSVNITTSANGGDALHSNMPPALIVNFVIRF